MHHPYITFVAAAGHAFTAAQIPRRSLAGVQYDKKPHALDGEDKHVHDNARPQNLLVSGDICGIRGNLFVLSRGEKKTLEGGSSKQWKGGEMETGRRRREGKRYVCTGVE